MDPAVSLSLDLSAGTLYFHLFMIHICYLDNSTANFDLSFRTIITA